MKKSLIYLFPILAFIIITVAMANQNISQNNSVTVTKGKVPKIDGVITENEWDDASVLNLREDGHVYLKHDEANLYIATDCAVGNFFIILDKTLYVFHASYSLGMAIYNYDDKYNLWSCTKKYFWELRYPQIRNLSNSERQNLFIQYMRNNGWVASTVPMAEDNHNEMAISFNRLGINPIIGDTNREIFPVLISHTKFHWPIGDKSPDEINLLIGGNSPGIIELDYSNWGKIIIK
jgi:hypothetical protein